MEGATKILYDSSGNPSYYKHPYKLYYVETQDGVAQQISSIKEYPEYYEDNNNDGVYEKASWKINYHSVLYDDTKIYKYLPSIVIDEKTIKDNNGNDIQQVGNIGLRALVVYVKECEDGVTVNYYDENNVILWSQPILILQNKYPSSMLNKWDGSLIMDEDNNAVLASKIAAGRKEKNDNTFTSVILGDWQEHGEKSITENTGVYGFYHGSMSYAFKDDGSAFIGKSGNGRIYFDGSDGKIYSSNWYTKNDDGSDNPLGMYIDVKQGIIKMRQNLASSANYIRQYITETDFNNQYQAGLFYYRLPYELSTSLSLDQSKIYYRASGWKRVDIDITQYAQNRYYILEPVKYGENNSIASTTFILSNQNFDGSKEYYYPSSFEQIFFTDNGDIVYEPNVYYVKDYENEEEIKYQPVNSSVFDPRYWYYKQSTAAANKFIDLDATAPENGYPLAIGDNQTTSQRKFRVRWDGTVFIENGVFNGHIDATSGTLGDLDVVGTLTGGYISGSHIFGTDITGGTIEGSKVYADYLKVSRGYIAGWRITDDSLKNSDGTIVLYSDNGSTRDGELAKFGGWKVTKLGFENRLGTYKDNNNIRTTNNFSYLKGGLISGSILDTPSGGMLLAGKFKLAQSLSPGFDTNTGIGNYLLIPGTIGVVMSDIETSPDAPEYYGIGLEYGEPVKSQIKATAVNVGMRYGVNQSIWITDKTIGLASNDGDLSIHSKSTINEYSATNINIGVKTGSGNNVQLYPQFESYYNGGQQTVTLGIYANDAITIGPVENIGASSCKLIRIGEQSLTVDVGAWTTNLNIGQNAQNIKIGEFAKTIVEIGSTSVPKINIGNTGAAVTIQNNLLTPNLYITNGFDTIDGNYTGTIVMNPSGFQLQNGSFTLGKEGASVSGNIYYNGSINLENGFNVTSGSINIGGGENEAIFGSIYYSGSVNLGNGLQITTGDLNIKGGSATFDNNLEVKGTVTIGNGLTVAEGATVTGVYATLV